MGELSCAFRTNTVIVLFKNMNDCLYWQTDMKQPIDVLRDTFGYDDFRFEQRKIIQTLLDKQDTLVLMPTGGGKSLCYQIPSLLLDGLTIVVSPLISLMKDQVDALRLNGISATYLNSSMTPDEQSRVIQQLRNNEIKLL